MTSRPFLMHRESSQKLLIFRIADFLRMRKRLLCWLVITFASPLTIGVASSATPPGAGRPVVRPEAAIVRALMLSSAQWTESLAKQFAKTIPARIIEALGTQTPSTIPFYMAQKRIPKIGVQNEYFCWASNGSGGGYAAFIHRDGGDYSTLWDSLVPATFLSPRIEFKDVDGDSTSEIICSGKLLDSDLREWLILGWDGEEGHVLAPRLDQPARHLWYNRLIGRALEITESPDSTAKQLILTLGDTPGDSVMASDSTTATRLFSYDKRLGGFLPAP